MFTLIVIVLSANGAPAVTTVPGFSSDFECFAATTQLSHSAKQDEPPPKTKAGKIIRDVPQGDVFVYQRPNTGSKQSAWGLNDRTSQATSPTLAHSAG
jgi:hypothetical protein